MQNLHVKCNNYSTSGATENTWAEVFMKQVSRSHSRAHGQSGRAQHAGGCAEDRAAGDRLRQAGTKVREQAILAEAKFSCREDMVRTSSPTERDVPRMNNSKVTFPPPAGSASSSYFVPPWNWCGFHTSPGQQMMR